MTATVFQPYIFALGVLTTVFSFLLIAVFLIVQIFRRIPKAAAAE